MSFQDIFQITEKKQQIENQQLFDGIIDVTLFVGVEGLDQCCTYMNILIKKSLQSLAVLRYWIKDGNKEDELKGSLLLKFMTSKFFIPYLS